MTGGGAMAGYSETPQLRKLGIAPGVRLRRAGCRSRLGVRCRAGCGEHPHRYGLDVVLAFVSTRADLERAVETQRDRIQPAGALWIAWPRAAAGARKRGHGEPDPRHRAADRARRRQGGCDRRRLVGAQVGLAQRATPQRHDSVDGLPGGAAAHLTGAAPPRRCLRPHLGRDPLGDPRRRGTAAARDRAQGVPRREPHGGARGAHAARGGRAHRHPARDRALRRRGHPARGVSAASRRSRNSFAEPGTTSRSCSSSSGLQTRRATSSPTTSGWPRTRSSGSASRSCSRDGEPVALVQEYVSRRDTARDDQRADRARSARCRIHRLDAAAGPHRPGGPGVHGGSVPGRRDRRRTDPRGAARDERHRPARSCFTQTAEIDGTRRLRLQVRPAARVRPPHGRRPGAPRSDQVDDRQHEQPNDQTGRDPEADCRRRRS